MIGRLISVINTSCEPLHQISRNQLFLVNIFFIIIYLNKTSLNYQYILYNYCYKKTLNKLSYSLCFCIFYHDRSLNIQLKCVIL